MKILPINFLNYKIQNNKLNNKQNSINTINKGSLYLPTTAQYLAFLGGYSINLNETYEHLKKEQYPVDIQENVLKSIKEGNAENKTLCDIHFEKYHGVLDCFSLDELADKFPEFENVISVWDIETKRKDGFIAKFQNDELDLFQNDEELALELVKLYWGQGFSLNDLSNYVAQNSKDGKGLNLYHTLKKLNIPLMDKTYANVLKLSNKEYNENFTTQMSIKRKEAQEGRLQKAQGEAVVIPRGPLSEAHKKHISESLKKYYEEHPEQIFEMSKRQKEFYKKHPEKREEMSEIMELAWQSRDGKDILKKLRKHMGKNKNTPSFEELLQDNNNTLASFWEKNVWAKEKLSKAIKQAQAIYKKRQEEIKIIKNLKSIPNELFICNIIPTQIIEKINAWAKAKNYKIDDLAIGKFLIAYKEELSKLIIANGREEKSHKITNEFFHKFPKEADIHAECLLLVLYKIEYLIKAEPDKLPESLKNDKGKINVLKYALNCAFNEINLPTMEFATTGSHNKPKKINEVMQAYLSILQQVEQLGCYDFSEFADDLLNKAYAKLEEKNKVVQSYLSILQQIE